ncbi:hypothetical protein LIER_17297 [Lithospermum erythrorhizon]|uniref:Uncharacterized protein n=1 Tax=Lithospermum erythrorhizon TaxID=34254 RepID=A0AAV3QDX8_LITER
MDAAIPSVTDTEAETTGNMERPSIGHGVDDTWDDDIDEVFPKDAGSRNKSKKRKHKNNTDASEPSVPKKKLGKKERAAKRVRKPERRARKDAEAKTAQENDVEEVVPEETEEAIPPVIQPSVDDEWLPEHEPQDDNEDDQAEDILLAQNEDILTADYTEGPSTGLITISPKLIEGTHVADMPLTPLTDEGTSGNRPDGTVQLLRDEIGYLDGVIQSSLARKSVLEAGLRSLNGEADPDEDAETPHA